MRIKGNFRDGNPSSNPIQIPFINPGTDYVIKQSLVTSRNLSRNLSAFVCLLASSLVSRHFTLETFLNSRRLYNALRS